MLLLHPCLDSHHGLYVYTCTKLVRALLFLPHASCMCSCSSIPQPELCLRGLLRHAAAQSEAPPHGNAMRGNAWQCNAWQCVAPMRLLHCGAPLMVGHPHVCCPPSRWGSASSANCWLPPISANEWMVLQAFLIGADSSGSSAIGKAICQRAEDVNADVVIASRHSKEVLAEGIMGSTSVYLARRCTKPLVLLP